MAKIDCPLLKGASRKGCCDLCATKLGPKRKRWCSDRCSKAFYDNHYYRYARKAVKRRDKYRCSVPGCGSREKLEVNHIVPCKQNHNTMGCWHHLSNLELICHDHHVQATKLQRENGDFDGPPPRQKPRRKKR